MITGFNHITLSAVNIKESIDFYRNVLGFNLEHEWEKGVYFSVGQDWFCINKIDQTHENKDNVSHIAFNVEGTNFDVMKEKILSSGAKVWKQNTSEGRSLYFQDPCGHKLEIHVGNLQTRLVTLEK